MKTILQRKVVIHYSIVIWFTILFLCLKPSKFQLQRQQWTRSERNWKRFPRGTWQKSEVKRDDRWSKDVGRKSLFVSLMDKCHLKNSELKAKHQKYKGRVVFRSEIEKMIQDLMQYSPNKDYQHLKWQQQKSWISSPDCRVAQDKRLTQNLLLPMEKWKMFPRYGKFPNWNVQTVGFVYHYTNDQNNGPVSKTQLFFLNGICMVTLWQDYCGEGNLRKSYCNTVWQRFPIENVCSCIMTKGLSFLCMWMTENSLERIKILIRSLKYSTKKSIWENQHLLLIMYTWAALKDNVK